MGRRDDGELRGREEWEEEGQWAIEGKEERDDERQWRIEGKRGEGGSGTMGN